MTQTNTPDKDVELDEKIRKCFKDTYMQTEGNTDLFDIEETIEAIKELFLTSEQEAYRKGYIDGGIGVINEQK